MKKRTRNLLLGVGGLLLSVGIISGCTNSFCSSEDTSRIMYAVDPGVSTYVSNKDEYIAKIDAANAEREEGQKVTYYTHQVFDDNPNLFQVIEIAPDGYYYQSKNVMVTVYGEDGSVGYKSALEIEKASATNEVIKTAITNTVNNGGYRPSLEYYALFDRIAFTKYALKTYNSNNPSNQIATSTMTAEQATTVLDAYGRVKFDDERVAYDDWTKDKDREMFYNYKAIHREVVLAIGIEASASNNYVNYYVNAMNSQTNNLKSCIVSLDREGVKYGNYGSYQSSVPMIHKDWGYAWSRGFFEGLLVYPVAFMIDGFTNLFGGIKANAVPQLLALVVVTIIVRLFIFAATFPSTIQQQKTQALQPELARIQAKYPNSNTSQVERQRLAQEQQALYKKHNVHPFLQLLVMVVQFPVFICVWGAMTGSAVLSTGEFLGLHLSSSIMSVLTNFTGWPGNAGWWTALVLFLLMAGAQFLSMKLPQWIQKAKNKKVAKLGVNPAQNQQNKTMTIVSYVMLAVIIFMGFSLPAAMGVYWFVGALVSLGQSFITMAIANATLRKKKNK